MKSLFTFLILLVINSLPFGISQLSVVKENCKNISDPSNCNAYYECDVNNVMVHKFCPDDMEWNSINNICEYSARCRNETNGENEIENPDEHWTTISAVTPLKNPVRPVYRPPVIRPPVVRPPSGSNGAVQNNQFNAFYSILLSLQVATLLYFWNK